MNFGHDPMEPLPFVVEAACFRIAQQALTNVARHAHAHTVHIRLRAHAGAVELLVSDDGTGFDVARARKRAATAGSLGLLGMQERALLAGGRLSIESEPNGGTTVRAYFGLTKRTDP